MKMDGLKRIPQYDKYMFYYLMFCSVIDSDGSAKM